MGRYERRIYFERLCELRAAARRALRVDRDVVCTIDDAIEWASAVIAAHELADAVAPRPAKG